MVDTGEHAKGRRGRHRGPKSHDADATVALPRRALLAPDQAPDPWAPLASGSGPSQEISPPLGSSTAPPSSPYSAQDSSTASSSLYVPAFPGFSGSIDDLPSNPYTSYPASNGPPAPYGPDHPFGVAADPFAANPFGGSSTAADKPFDDSLTSFALSPAFHSPQPVVTPPPPRAAPATRKRPWVWMIVAAVALVLVVVVVLVIGGRGPAASTAAPNPVTSPARVGGLPFTSGTASGYWRITQQKWEEAGVVVAIEVTVDTGNLNYTLHAIGMNESTTLQPDPVSTIDSPGFVSAGTTLTGTLEFVTARQPLMLILQNGDGLQISALQVTA